MKKTVILVSILFLGICGISAQQNKKVLNEVNSTVKDNNKYKGNTLIYGPKSAAKIKSLFFTNTGFKLPATISEINVIAKYTGFETIESAGNIYTWDFNNGFQISAITQADGTPGGNDKISVVNFNYGNIKSLELGNTISLNQSTLATIQKLYPKLIKFQKAEKPAYKLKVGSIYSTFYFNEKNKLVSLSLSGYDLEF